ncbi:hypothetical protein ABPG74_015146 [Tetrahymena malaccensis]
MEKDELFKFQFQELENISNYFSDDLPLEEIARNTILNLKYLNENVPAENKLHNIVDNRVNSIYESGLLDLKLKKILKQEEKELKTAQQNILDSICNNFWTYITVRGDGNCFYRSFIVSYILKISLIESCEHLSQLIKIVQGLEEIIYVYEQNKEEDFNEETLKSSVISFESTNTLEEAGENNSNKPCIVESIRKNCKNDQNEEIKTIVISFLLQMLINKKKQNNFSISDFFEFYNSNPQLDFSLIIVCKNLLLVEYEHMQQDSDSKFFIDDSMTKEITNMLLVYGQSASDLVFSLAARAFKCKLQVQNIYYKDENTLIHNLLPFGFKEMQESNNEQIAQVQQIYISVWYTGGHYDILFDQQFSQQYMYFCFDEPIINQKQQTIKNIYSENITADDLYNKESPINIKSPNLYEEIQNDFYNLDGDIFQNNSNQINNDDNLFIDDDEKYQTINKIIKKNVCFCCNISQDSLFQLQTDMFICKSCYQNQYNIFRFEGPSNSILNALQIKQYFNEMTKENLDQSRCICCNQIEEQYQEFQKLNIIFTKQDQEIQSQNHIKLSQNDEQITKQKLTEEGNIIQQKEVTENKINCQNLEELAQIKDSLNRDQNDDQSVDSIEKFQTCLFCKKCLIEQIFNQNQNLQEKDYQIYLHTLQTEVDVCFKPSLNQYFIDFIKQECLMDIQNIQTQEYCLICNKELIQLQLQDIVAQNCNKETVKICCQCLNNTNLQKENTIYNQNSLQFFQIQYFLYHIKCFNINLGQCFACNKFQNIQTDKLNQSQQIFFEFTFLENQFSICFECTLVISFANEQSVFILVKDLLMLPLKIFLGQKQIYNLLKFASQACKWCKKINLDNQQNIISNINSIQLGQQNCLYKLSFECYECQQFYQQQQLQQQNFGYKSVNDFNLSEFDCPSPPIQINGKRRYSQLGDIQQTCNKCNIIFYTDDYFEIDECEKCRFTYNL